MLENVEYCPIVVEEETGIKIASLVREKHSTSPLRIPLIFRKTRTASCENRRIHEIILLIKL
jgi:hypothetical protein